MASDKQETISFQYKRALKSKFFSQPYYICEYIDWMPEKSTVKAIIQVFFILF